MTIKSSLAGAIYSYVAAVAAAVRFKGGRLSDDDILFYCYCTAPVDDDERLSYRLLLVAVHGSALNCATREGHSSHLSHLPPSLSLLPFVVTCSLAIAAI